MKKSNILDIIKSRRSIRKFTNETVPDDVIKTLIEAGSWAPNPSNLQSTKFIVVKSEAVKKSLANAVNKVISQLEAIPINDEISQYLKTSRYYFTFFENAPIVIAVAYKLRSPFIPSLSGVPVTNESQLSEISGASAAIENILLTAHSLGYGSCWMTGPLFAERDLAKILELKNNYKIAALIPIGKPDGEVTIPERKDIDKIMKVVE